MEIRPILSALRRHKTAALLVIAEITLACAIISNAAFLISQRLERMQIPSGVAERSLLVLRSAGSHGDEAAKAVVAREVAALRNIAGVRSVAMVNQVPFGGSAWVSGVNLKPDQKNTTANVSTYYGSRGVLDTLGLTLTQGRDFNQDEYVPAGDTLEPGSASGVGIITEALARKLFGDASPLGQVLYMDKAPITIVGTVRHLISTDEVATGIDDSILQPRVPDAKRSHFYVLRVDPARRDAILRTAADTLTAASPHSIVRTQKTMQELRDAHFRQDRYMAWLLVAVCLALLVVTALGIVGLASFWVAQRTRQIGIRRALGATRGQILRYFQIENFLLAGIGIVFGMLLAYGINLWLMGHYEIARMPLIYFPVGAIALWLLGQAAVLWPARRAARVPPVVATRSV